MDSSISSSLSSIRLVLLWSASDGLLSTVSPLFPFPCLLAILECFNFTLSYSISRHAYTFIVPLPQNSEPWLMKGERIRHSSYWFILRVFYFLRDGWSQYEFNILWIIMHYNNKHMVFASWQNSQSTMPVYHSEKQHVHSPWRYRTKLRQRLAKFKRNLFNKKAFSLLP